MDLAKGYVFDIQRYSIHDGPGIRSTEEETERLAGLIRSYGLRVGIV